MCLARLGIWRVYPKQGELGGSADPESSKYSGDYLWESVSFGAHACVGRPNLTGNVEVRKVALKERNPIDEDLKRRSMETARFRRG